jgi:HK97 family phage portal protein
MGSSDLAIRGGWFPRLLKALRLVEVRDDGTTNHIAGSDFIGDTASPRQYSAINSMSAMSAFPWVRSCVEAISADLSGLPIRVIRGRGADAEQVDDHPVLDLLDRPSSTVPGVLFRRQMIVDLVLSGDAFLLIAGADEPRALIRLHPERVRVIPSDDGQVQGYEYSGAGATQRYTVDQVLHIRLPSWQDTPAMLYGTGAIEALQHDLTTDLAASKLAAASASNGMPTGIISPSEEGDRWSAQQIKQLREGFEKQLKSKSGVVLLGAGVDYKQLSMSMRDMEYQNTRIMAREAVLAAMGVPPVVVGLPNANFATAQAQRRQFAETQQGRAALIDSELTRLARMFPDSDGVRVVHDFSEVDALQESRTERVNRVQSWYMMGVPLHEAAALEGFDQLDSAEVDPATDGDAVTGGTAAADGGKSLSAQALNGAQIASLLQILAAVAAGSITFDAAMQLVSVAFPTIDPAAASAILSGARAVEDPTSTKGQRRLRSLIVAHGVGGFDTVAQWLAPDQIVNGLDTEDGRAAVWRAFVKEVQGPAEKKVALNMRRYLRGLSARIASRLKDEMPTGKGVTRAVDDKLLKAILSERFEAEQISQVFQPIYKSMLSKAMEGAYQSISLDEVIDADAIQAAANAEVVNMTRQTQATTNKAVAETLQAGFQQGATLPEIQANLVNQFAFSPARAMIIARTEATRVSNQGAADAYRKADALGVKVQKQWLSSRDALVRDSHIKLDSSEPIPVGAEFASGGGSADVPGGFGIGAEDINCRCTIVGVIAK